MSLQYEKELRSFFMTSIFLIIHPAGDVVPPVDGVVFPVVPLVYDALLPVVDVDLALIYWE
jgi:hypothetical protein